MRQMGFFQVLHPRRGDLGSTGLRLLLFSLVTACGSGQGCSSSSSEPKPDSGGGEEIVVLGPTEGMLVDPTDPDATYAIELTIWGDDGAVDGLEASLDGVALVVEDTVDGFESRASLSSVPVSEPALLHLEAPGYLPENRWLSFSQHSGMLALQLRPAVVTAEVPADAELVVEVGANQLTLPQGVFDRADTLELRAGDLDIVTLALDGAERTIAARLAGALPSAGARVEDDIVGMKPGLPVVSLDVVVETSAGESVELPAGASIGVELAIPEGLWPHFPTGSEHVVYRYDADTHAFEPEGGCFVTGGACVGEASSLSVALLLPTPAYTGFGCARARVGVEGPEASRLVDRSVNLEVAAIDSSSPVHAEVRYERDGDALVLTSVFPAMYEYDQRPDFFVSSQLVYEGDPAEIQTLRSQTLQGLFFASSRGDPWEDCKGVEPAEVTLTHGLPGGDAQEVELTETGPEDPLERAVVCSEAELSMTEGFASSPTALPATMLWADFDGEVVLEATSDLSTMAPGNLVSVIEAVETPDGQSAAYPDAETSSIWWWSGVATETVPQQSVLATFSRPATDRGEDWRYVVVALGLTPDDKDSRVIFSQAMEQVGYFVSSPEVHEQQEFRVPFEVVFLDGDESAYQANVYALPASATELEVLFPEQESTLVGSFEGFVFLAVGMMAVPVCEVTP